ncbi:hypothetical protein CR513_56592, partial [Mucuna pruriens]
MALSKYDIVYLSQKAIKGSALTEHLAHHPILDYQPLQHEFCDEYIMIVEWNWSSFSLVEGPIFPFSARQGFNCTNNMEEYEACAMGIMMALNNKMMTELCEQFKIRHHNSTPYCPKMNELWKPPIKASRK